MSAPNIPIKEIETVRDSLNEIGPGFCLAKWLQVTIHLQNGQTHSCHHPITHKIHKHELKKDVSALHNTSQKKLARKEMLEGNRPSECDYCWKIEDASSSNLSDRAIKSAQPWSQPRMTEVKNLPWSSSITPSYVEVSFGNECNFKCAYCAPHISSSIMKELREFGPYTSQGGFAVDKLKEEGLYPFSKDEENPYVEAFWKWWPQLTTTLKVFRVTGGEPLLNPNTFRLLDYFKNNPMPDLTFAVNSNLGVPEQTFKKFLQEVKYLTDNKLIKEFQLFTSIDTFGKNAEFVRFGLNYELLMNNVKTYLNEIKDSELIFMCAYNAFSVLNYRKFLEEVFELKKSYMDSKNKTRVTLDIPYLKDPNFLSCYILTDQFIDTIREDILFMKNNVSFNKTEMFLQEEIAKLERIQHWMESLEENEHRNNTRREFVVFLKEYCQRKKINYLDYLPEYSQFIDYCSSL